MLFKFFLVHLDLLVELIYLLKYQDLPIKMLTVMSIAQDYRTSMRGIKVFFVGNSPIVLPYNATIW